MTRQEEIRSAAEQALKDCPYINTSLIGFDFFVKGAMWADEHPADVPDIIIESAIAYSDGYDAAIDKASQWLQENAAMLWESPCNPDRIVEQFKKAMQDENN